MERLRTDLIRRARMERQGDEEQAIPEAQPHASRSEMEEQRQPRARFTFNRPALPRLFGAREQDTSSRPDDESHIDSPKSPDVPSHRLNLPHLARTWTNMANMTMPNLSSPGPAHQPLPEMPVPPEPTATPRPVSSRYGPASTGPADDTAFSGPDPAEAHLARLAEDGRRRNRRKKARRAGHSGREHKKRQPPKRFLFCFPWVKSQRLRSRILRCFVSGMFLFSLLAVCKS